jgi:type II secretory pathway component PulK
MTRAEQPKMSKKGMCTLAGHAGNERGMALVIALVMLVLLTMLGAWALDTSSTDLRISGNSKTTQVAYYAAEAGVGYASNREVLKSSYVATGASVTNQGQSLGNSSFQTVTRFLIKAPLPAGAMYESNLQDLGSEKLPVYFTLNSQGTAVNNSIVNIEACVVLIP